MGPFYTMPIDWEVFESNFDINLDNTRKYRYFLTVKHKKKKIGKTLIAFMMNPSHAGQLIPYSNIIQSDLTINLLIDVFGEEYNRIIIFNNHPLYEANSNNLSSGEEELETNSKKIDMFLGKYIPQHDLYVGVGQKGFGAKKKDVKEYFLKNMNILSKKPFCDNIYISGFNSSDHSPIHPKYAKKSCKSGKKILKEMAVWENDELHLWKPQKKTRDIYRQKNLRKKLRYRYPLKSFKLLRYLVS